MGGKDPRHQQKSIRKEKAVPLLLLCRKKVEAWPGAECEKKFVLLLLLLLLRVAARGAAAPHHAQKRTQRPA